VGKENPARRGAFHQWMKLGLSTGGEKPSRGELMAGALRGEVSLTEDLLKKDFWGGRSGRCDHSRKELSFLEKGEETF